MKPIRSFFFLSGLLILVLFADGILKRAGKEGLTDRKKTDRAFTESLWLDRSGKQDWAREEETELNKLQQSWVEDSLMQAYRSIYRLDAGIFLDAQLQGIPLTPLEFDTSRTGRMLLDDFFVRLLILENPRHESSLRQYYQKPDFWAEALAENRKYFTRILHYGDAQIENDHITSTLRAFFQKDFGGTGPGLLPLFQSGRDLSPKISGNWHKVKAEKGSRKGNFGVYTAYLGSQPLNTIIRSKNPQYGYLHFDLASHTDNTDDLSVDLIVHSQVQAGDLEIRTEKEKLSSPRILSAYNQQRLSYRLPLRSREISLRLDIGKKNRSLYAIAVNDTSGLSIDNLSMKGSTGYIFTPNNRRFLTDQFNLLNVGLIIYQFGIPSLLEAASPGNYDYYRMLLMQDLSYIRAQMPNIPVIVVGLADYPAQELPPPAGLDTDKLRRIQKEVALQTGCIFWNLGQAMGGNGSIVRWSEAEPTLVAVNCTRFSEKGAELVGKLFYKAILDAYRDFLLRECKERMLERGKQLQKTTKN